MAPGSKTFMNKLKNKKTKFRECQNHALLWIIMSDGEPKIPLGLNRETTQYRTSSNTGFVDTAKFPITGMHFFFIYLKQMLSEKWQDATPSKRSLCLLEKSLLLQWRQNFSSWDWDWHERGKSVPHLEVSVFLFRIPEKRKILQRPALQLYSKCTFSAAQIRTPLNLWDMMRS